MGGLERVSWEDSRKWYKEHQPAVWEEEKARAAKEAGVGGGKVKTSLPCVTVLDFFFPPGTKVRQFLEGLLKSPPHRLSSRGAL